MLKEIYIFTNGVVMAFGWDGQQQPEFQGPLTQELKEKLLGAMEDTTRITLSRWKRGFFALTKEEFLLLDVENNELIVKFGPVGGNPEENKDVVRS